MEMCLILKSALVTKIRGCTKIQQELHFEL